MPEETETIKAKLKDLNKDKFVIPYVPVAGSEEAAQLQEGFGLVKGDGTTTVVDNGVLSVSSATLASKANQSDLETLQGVVAGKQDTLTAGSGISIDANNEISCTAQIDVDDHMDPASENPVQNKVITQELGSKQDTLSAGEGVIIENNVVSVDIEKIQSNDKYIAGNKIVIDTTEISTAENTQAVWHFDKNTKDAITGLDLASLGVLTEEGVRKFGTRAFSVGNTVTTVEHHLDALSVDGPITLEFFFLATVDDTNELFVGLTGDRFDRSAFTLCLINNGLGGIAVKDNTSTLHPVSNANVHPGWNHVALTYYGQTKKCLVYVNGKKAVDEPISLTIAYGVDSMVVYNYLTPLPGGAENTTAGIIDEFRISNTLQYISDFAVPQHAFMTYEHTIGVNEQELTSFVDTKVIAGVAGKQDALGAEQVLAINSGITSAKVATYDGYNSRITANSTNISALSNSKQDKLVAGANITIDQSTNTISATAELSDDVWQKTNLVAGDSIAIVKQQGNGGIDSYTKVCCHFDNSLKEEVSGNVMYNNMNGMSYGVSTPVFGVDNPYLIIHDNYYSHTFNYRPSVRANQEYTADVWFLYTGNTSYSHLYFTNGTVNYSAANRATGVPFIGTVNYVDENNDPMSLQNGSWYHFALVLDPTLDECRFYLSGILQAKASYRAALGENSFYFDRILGTFDELRVSDVVRYTDNFADDLPETEYTKDEETGVYEVKTTLQLDKMYTKESAAALTSVVNTKRQDVEVVTDLVSTSKELSVAENTAYHFGTLDSLHLLSAPETDRESFIYFTANADNCLSWENTIRTIGTISVKTGKSYAVSIVNKILVVGELN